MLRSLWYKTQQTDGSNLASRARREQMHRFLFPKSLIQK